MIAIVGNPACEAPRRFYVTDGRRSGRLTAAFAASASGVNGATRKLIDAAEADGRLQLVEVNRKLETNLTAIIDHL